MTDYINRGFLLADIENTIRISAKDTNSSELRGARKVIDRIKAMSSTDVQPVVHGKWERHSEPSNLPIYFTCENCGAVGLPTFNFCPNCGARMVNDNL